MKAKRNDMKVYFKNALRYVKKNKTWSNAEESHALEMMDSYRCPLEVAAPSIPNDIYDLMLGFSTDNNLPERWWRQFATEEQIFMLL